MHRQQPVLLVFWACDETPSSCRRGTHNSIAATYRTSRAETSAAATAAAAAVATVVVRIATPTPDLGQLRRLPRQAMHRAGTSPRTIKNALFFFWSDALLAMCSFLCQFIRDAVASLRSYFFTCLANHSAVTCCDGTFVNSQYSGIPGSSLSQYILGQGPALPFVIDCGVRYIRWGNGR